MMTPQSFLVAGSCLYINPADQAKLEEIVANRSSPRKWVWRAEIVLATADGLGTNAIMRRGVSKQPLMSVTDRMWGRNDGPAPVRQVAARKTGTYWIKPTAFPLDVARGPVGTTFTVHLKGVGWTEANIYHVVYDNNCRPPRLRI
jgi:hypothetical protein